jgi:hypothetical protein
VSYSGDSNYAFTSNNSSVKVSSVQPVAGNVSLDFSPSAYPSITTAQPLLFVADLFGSGFLAPIVVTGSVTVTGGGYNSGAVPLTEGLATINIPAGALAVGNDTFAVNYSGDSNYAAEDFTNQITITVIGTSLPTITSFVASPATITAGASSTLTGVFSNGSGVITPGNISVTSGTGVSVSPTATTTYTLTVTPTTGTAVTQTATVTVQSATPVPAALTSPTPGLSTKLGSSNVSFQWTAGTGVTDYQFSLSAIGSGLSDLYVYKGTGTSTIVTSLPANGETVYATLYSLINGAWQSSDYVYTESGTPVPAVLAFPTPGSIIGSSSVSFQWTAGTGVTDYQLSLSAIGSGLSDLFLYKGTATSAVVSTIPANGETVYATLYSKINGAWQSNDYVYFESGTPAPAVLTFPTPGTVLGTSNVSFQWTAGTGATDYQLNVSAIAPGDSDLYLHKGTATSTVVSTIPANGVTVYARLYSKINGMWLYNDYVYFEQQ